MKIDGLLHRVTSLIVTACDPEKIILFGSYAKGQQNNDSDVDILVIADFMSSSVLRDQELRQLLHSCVVRIDLHVVSVSEIELESSKPFSFLNAVVSSGMILYSRNNA